MKKGNTVKTFVLLALVAVVALGAFWAKGYYNDRYMLDDSYYTQVPLDEVNEDSWIVNGKGEPQEKGKEYTLIGYNKDGEKREVHFRVRGTAENYYAPGTYMRIDMSKTIEVGEARITEEDVPQKALSQIKQLGTRK